MIKVRINPGDPLLVMAIKDGLQENDGYCPCRINHTPDTKCRCKEFRDQIEAGKEGLCHCGLWEAYDDRKQ